MTISLPSAAVNRHADLEIEYRDPRFGLGVGAIFAAVASEYIVIGSLPDSNVLTLADKLHMVAFGFIFLSLAESTYSLKLFNTGREALSRTLDHWSLGVMASAYVIITIVLVTVAG